MACFCDKGGLTAIRNVFQDADTLSLPFHLAHLLINIVTQVSCAFFVFEVSKFVCYFKRDKIQMLLLNDQSGHVFYIKLLVIYINTLVNCMCCILCPVYE